MNGHSGDAAAKRTLKPFPAHDVYAWLLDGVSVTGTDELSGVGAEWEIVFDDRQGQPPTGGSTQRTSPLVM